jgi:hypothetical protein
MPSTSDPVAAVAPVHFIALYWRSWSRETVARVVFIVFKVRALVLSLVACGLLFDIFNITACMLITSDNSNLVGFYTIPTYLAGF